MSSLIATSKFQSMIPSVLQGVSPSMAAYHTTRAALLNNNNAQIDHLHCPRCGAFVLRQNGKLNVSTSWAKRSSRSQKASTSRRILQTACSNCCFVTKTAYSTESRSRFSKVRSSRSDMSPARAGDPDPQFACASNSASLKEPVHTIVVVSTDRPKSSVIGTAQVVPFSKEMSTVSSTPSSANIGAPWQTKQKSGLQEMLRRKREKEKATKTAKPVAQGGLAAFLDGLD